MRGWMSAVLIMALVLSGVAQYPVQSVGATIYSTDFSSDPGWTTDQGDKCYWDSAAEEYVVNVKNSNPGTEPSRYAYANTSYNSESFRMEWNQKMTRCDWSAGVNFGLYASDLKYYGGLVPPAKGTINVEYFVADGGRGISLRATDISGTDKGAGSYPGYALDTWYHNVLNYDAVAGTLNVRVTNADTGVLLTELSLAGLGVFSSEMTRIGVSRHPVGVNGSFPGGAPSNIAEARIDNVSLDVVPEPSTLVLLGIGAIGLLAYVWRRRRRTA